MLGSESSARRSSVVGKLVLRRARYWRLLHALAAELLAERGYRIAALDNEPEVVLVKAHDLVRVQEAIWSKQYYVKLDTGGAELVPEMTQSFEELCKRVAAVSGTWDGPLFRQLMKPMHCEEAWYVSRLGCCASHTSRRGKSLGGMPTLPLNVLPWAFHAGWRPDLKSTCYSTSTAALQCRSSWSTRSQPRRNQMRSLPSSM